ncbi:hypothetical protein CY34DRAFT_799997 [Suillus luteus UH-Slu-Lm8-n1]|uniref:Uncharacterized protein n=1 Tax=Suillus luteus UH-Slu-Lm8-n1 TaxID=930992 RepID=A0A0D0A9E3_9AGAM|nr:hypothetical protein CY34DRAFT_799997 [Suillus luteus UH-Slu-Lm8-n1]
MLWALQQVCPTESSIMGSSLPYLTLGSFTLMFVRAQMTAHTSLIIFDCVFRRCPLLHPSRSDLLCYLLLLPLACCSTPAFVCALSVVAHAAA